MIIFLFFTVEFSSLARCTYEAATATHTSSTLSYQVKQIEMKLVRFLFVSSYELNKESSLLEEEAGDSLRAFPLPVRLKLYNDNVLTLV